MRTFPLSFLCFFLAFVGGLSTLYAQKPKIDITPISSSPTIEIKFYSFPVLEQGDYTYAPFFQGFSIWGDGNFKRLGGRGIGESLESLIDLSYTYRNMNNSYPMVMLLTARKTDAPPPIIFPEGTNILVGKSLNGYSGFVEITDITSPGQDNPPVIKDLSEGSMPTSPMITGDEGSDERVAIGLSHYAEGEYYVKDEDVHVFPIAYRPRTIGDAVLLFFYNDGMPDFEYFKEIQFEDPDLKTGTILPNYYDTPSQLETRMNFIREWSIGTFSPPVSGQNTSFQNYIIYHIPEKELELLKSPTSLSEVRLFCFLKARFINPLKESYSFLVVLYDSEGEITTNLKQDQAALNAIDTGLMKIPPVLELDGLDTLNFADAHLLTARGNEPHDPNALSIEDIYREGDDYRIHFKLEFCNDETATAATPGTTILLQEIDKPIRDYQITECFPSANKGCNSELCGFCPSAEEHCSDFTVDGMNPGAVDVQQFCLDFEPDSLGIDRCAYIRFSARIEADDIDELVKQPVLQFCLQLSGVINSPDFCGKNLVLEDTLCQVKYTRTEPNVNTENAQANFSQLFWGNSKKPSRIVCVPNPIWESRNRTTLAQCGLICQVPWFWCFLTILLVLLGYLVGEWLSAKSLKT